MRKVEIFTGNTVVKYSEGENCKRIYDQRHNPYPIVKIVNEDNTIRIYSGYPFTLDVDPDAERELYQKERDERKKPYNTRNIDERIY